MGTKKTRNVPAGLERVRRRFERWRQTRQGRARIPDSLWASAIQVAKEYGIGRTAQVLRLDYYGLKRRVQENGKELAVAHPAEAITTFLELPSATVTGSCECSVELENAGGTRMRICLRGIEAPDVSRLSRALWDGES